MDFLHASHGFFVNIGQFEDLAHWRAIIASVNKTSSQIVISFLGFLILCRIWFEHTVRLCIFCCPSCLKMEHFLVALCLMPASFRAWAESRGLHELRYIEFLLVVSLGNVVLGGLWCRLNIKFSPASALGLDHGWRLVEEINLLIFSLNWIPIYIRL